MISSQNRSISPKSSHNFSLFLTSRKRRKNHNAHKKTSEEDLVEEGFTIGRLLGEGSYCKVKAAKYKDHDIAVKIITRNKLSNDFHYKFLPREIDILSKIRHENIIRVYKIFNYPKTVYIFMELANRGDLLTLIRNRGRLSESEACHYFHQMVSAVRYLHSLHIAHRDLKCENIMINDRNHIKIIDFGFGLSTINGKGMRELSRTFCGSTAYAAPEILQGVPYNPMMYDVWSLGCILFIMVVGKMPFNDDNVRKLVADQLRRRIRYPDTFQVSRSAKGLISRMLEPDVTRRATMNQVSRSNWILANKGGYWSKSIGTLPREAHFLNKENSGESSNYTAAHHLSADATDFYISEEFSVSELSSKSDDSDDC